MFIQPHGQEAARGLEVLVGCALPEAGGSSKDVRKGLKSGVCWGFRGRGHVIAPHACSPQEGRMVDPSVLVVAHPALGLHERGPAG